MLVGRKNNEGEILVRRKSDEGRYNISCNAHSQWNLEPKSLTFTTINTTITITINTTITITITTQENIS